MKRPLCWMGLVSLAATAAFCHAPVGWMAAAVALAAVALALWLGCDRADVRRAMLLPLLCCAVGALLWCQLWQTGHRARLAPLVERPAHGLLTVTEVGRRGRAWAYTGRATLTADDDPSGRPLTLELTATCFFPLDCAPGDLLQISGELQPPPRGFAALSQGEARFYLDRVTTADPAARPHPLLSRLVALRQALSAAATRLVPGEGGPLLAALLAGDRSGLSPALTLSLRQSGLSHLAVVSGLHLSTLALLVAALLGRLLPGRARLQAGLVVSFCWGFALFTGLGPSVVRAAVMLTLIKLGPLLNRQGDGPTSLVCAGLLLGLADPRTVGSVSFGLSFLATGGILLLGKPLERWLLTCLPVRRRCGAWAGLCSALSITTAAQLGSAPLLLGVFGQVSLWGLAANLPAAPLVFLLLPLGWVALLGAALFPALSGLLGGLCSLLLRPLLGVIGFFGGLPFGQVGLTERYQFLWLGAAYLAAGYLLARKAPPRLVGRVGLSLLACLLLAANGAAALSRGSVELLVVGDQQAAVLARGERAGLFGAPSTAREAEQLADALERLGVRRLDFVLLLDAADADQPVAALARAMGCDALLAPDTPSVRAFCRSAGLTLCALPQDDFSPLGIPARYRPGAIEFSIAGGTVLKTEANCAIITDKVVPLPAPGRGITRYRLRSEEGAA